MHAYSAVIAIKNVRLRLRRPSIQTRGLSHTFTVFLCLGLTLPALLHEPPHLPPNGTVHPIGTSNHTTGILTAVLTVYNNAVVCVINVLNPFVHKHLGLVRYTVVQNS